jgi:prepilin-type N-terminal cleavage/methylation domain-containing protein
LIIHSNVKNKKTNKNLNKGFTLIELVVSIAMVTILSTVVLKISRFSDTHKSLTLARDEVRVAVRMAQNSSLSIPNPEQKHICGYGLYIEDNKTYNVFYTYISDSDFSDNPNTCQEEASYRSFNLVDSAQVAEISSRKLGDALIFTSHIGESIFFRVPYSELFGDNGELLAFDFVIDIQNTNVGATKSVTINNVGKIE